MEGPSARFMVGEWLVEPRIHRVTGGGRSVLVEPKVMQVLVCLAAHPGDVLDRETLLDRVWDGVVVTDHVLTRSISELRRIFGDDARRPSVIETIPKTGYRLIAPVRLAPPGADRSVLNGSDGYAGDAAPHLTDVALSPPPDLPIRPIPASGTRNRPSLWIAVLLALLAAIQWFTYRRAETDAIRPWPSHLFTSFPGQENQPSFSPDGRQVAFVRRAEGAAPQVYTRLVGTESMLQLTDAPGGATSPAWSPDGRWLAYRAYGEDPCGVYVVPALGGPSRRMAPCNDRGYSLAWSPDGRWLATTAPDSTTGRAGLMLIGVDRNERRILSRPDPSEVVDHTPRFSPDGSRLAFIRRFSPNMSDVYLLTLGSGQEPPERLTYDHRHVAGLAWDADGKHLLFSSNRAGNYRLWTLPVSGGEPTWMASAGAYDPGSLDVSPDGTRLVYEEWDFQINVWQTATDGSTVDPWRRLVASTRWDYHPAYAPDGRRMAFASNRSGSFELWVAGSDGAAPLRLTDTNGPFVGFPRWSPDGTTLVFVREDLDGPHLFRVDASGGPVSRLDTGPGAARAPAWSHDGSRLYFASDRDGAWQIWTVPAAGGLPRRVTEEGGYQAAESPDGRTLYYSKYGAPGLWHRPAQGGAEAALPIDLDVEDWGNWTLGPAGIYFVRRTANGAELALFSLETGDSRVLRSLDGRTLSHEPGLSLSPDGRSLLLALADRVESDLVLVDRSER